MFSAFCITVFGLFAVHMFTISMKNITSIQFPIFATAKTKSLLAFAPYIITPGLFLNRLITRRAQSSIGLDPFNIGVIFCYHSNPIFAIIARGWLVISVVAFCTKSLPACTTKKFRYKRIIFYSHITVRGRTVFYWLTVVYVCHP